MPELIAQGREPGQIWRKTLPTSPLKLGRGSNFADWAVRWDQAISRLHAVITWQGDYLKVRRHPGSRNPIVFSGREIAEGEEFQVGLGEEFEIGKTTFRVCEALEPPAPFSLATVGPDELREVTFTDLDKRIEALVELPGLIRGAPSATELEARALDVLLRGIPRASVVAVVRVRPEGDGTPELCRWAGKDQDTDSFRPSWRLVTDAVRRCRRPVIHVWGGGKGAAPEGSGSGEKKEAPPDSAFTRPANFNWALCAPLPDEPDPGWALYVAGSLPMALLLEPDPARSPELQGDLKFAKLVADIFGGLRQIISFRDRQAYLDRLLSGPVRAALSRREPDDVLRPRAARVTVLFCDLRGSCRIVEDAQADLPQLWERVSEALGLVTSGISDRDGVIGDFQGDAAMGFWGWPIDTDDQVIRAARAALDIVKDFAQRARPGTPLADFRCGIGIAHGVAYAGRLGTPDQIKVGVFGSVVNLASRLESLTKTFRVPILMDEAAALALHRRMDDWARVRRVARIRPYGMQAETTIYELMLPHYDPRAMTEAHRLDYEAAYDFFLAGRWPEAGELLARLRDDGPSEFLSKFMASHPAGPPPDWRTDQTIEMSTK